MFIEVVRLLILKDVSSHLKKEKKEEQEEERLIQNVEF